jgi:flagellar assembly factor FliW
LAFLLLDPLLCKPDYEFLISPEDRKALELPDSCEGMQTLVIVNIAPGDSMEITANLLGPVVMNVKKRLARQIVLYQSPYSTRFPIPTVKE